MHTITLTQRELASSPSDIRSGKHTEMTIDLENWSYARPSELVRVRSIIDLAIDKNMKVKIIPPLDTDCKNYAGRMELFRGTDYTYPYHQNNSTSFFPLIKITSDRNERVYDECRKVFTHSNATPNYVNRLCDAFVELADNIFFHSGESENSGWGYIHAQAYLQSGTIRLGLSDVGVGIYGSYKRTGQLRGRSEQDLAKDVFEELESSLNPGPQKGHRGLGLHEVQSFINKHTGHLTLHTGNVKVDVNQVGIFPETSSFHTEGTWIQMRVPIR